MSKRELRHKAARCCDYCRSEIPVLDFQEGRATLISGRTCCSGCLEAGTWFGAGTTSRPANLPEGRACTRFVPSLQLDLELRLPGWRGVMGGNLARQWLDVSETGLRAVVRRRCAIGDFLSVRVHHLPESRTHTIIGTVRRVQDSPGAADSVVAGIEFANATVEFRNVIRKLHGVAGLLKPEADVKKDRRQA